MSQLTLIFAHKCLNSQNNIAWTRHFLKICRRIFCRLPLEVEKLKENITSKVEPIGKRGRLNLAKIFIRKCGGFLPSEFLMLFLQIKKISRENVLSLYQINKLM